MSRRSSRTSSHDQEEFVLDCKAAYSAVIGDVKTDIRSKLDLMEGIIIITSLDEKSCFCNWKPCRNLSETTSSSFRQVSALLKPLSGLNSVGFQ